MTQVINTPKHDEISIAHIYTSSCNIVVPDLGDVKRAISCDRAKFIGRSCSGINAQILTLR